MRFPRQRVIDAIEAGLVENRARYDRRVAKFAEEQERHIDQWFDDHADAWREYAAWIKETLARNEPITRGYAPKRRDGHGDQVAYYSPLTNGPSATYHEPIDLVELAEFFKLADDDTISSNSLKEHGLATSMRKLTPYLRIVREQMQREKTTEKEN